MNLNNKELKLARRNCKPVKKDGHDTEGQEACQCEQALIEELLEGLDS